MKEGYAQHEEVLSDMIADLEEEGYRVIRLAGKSPDAIAVRDQYEIHAVEVLGKTHRKGRGWHTSWSYKQKKKDYSMFDEVMIRTFKRNKNYQKGGPNY